MSPSTTFEKHARAWLLPVLTFVGITCLAGVESARAAAILSVDLGGTRVEAGFTGALTTLSDTAGPQTATFSILDPAVTSGSIVMTIAGTLDFSTASLNVRTRGTADSGDFTYGDLFVDRVVDTKVGGEGLFLRLSGLEPNTAYSLQVWGYDSINLSDGGGGKGGFVELFNRTAGSNLSLGSYTVPSGALPQNNNDFSVTGFVTADASGTIVVQSKSEIDGRGLMNGFVLSTVPEPATAVTLLGGMGMLIAGARFRRSR